MDDAAIRAAVRQKLGESWPQTRTRLFKEVGPGDGGACSACGDKIAEDYEVRIVYTGGRTLRLHLACERIWRDEVG